MKSLIAACALGFGLLLGTLGLLRIASDVAQAQELDGYDTYYVAPGGECGAGIVPCYDSVQAAVDAADDPADLIKIAAGVYIDLHPRDGITQVVYISKTLAIQG